MKPNQKFYLATCLSLIMTIVPAMAFSQTEALPTETSMLFSGSGNCAFCHTSNGVALTDSKGIDLSISTDWRATMMGNSARDPLWQAKVESEVMENPALKALIEDKCTTCHAPMGRTQAVHDGASGYSIEAMRTNALAMDGVSCTACHQIQPENLGTDASFSGKYQIEDTRQIFGPYQDVVPMPMMHHTGYTPQYGEHIHKSELCATCHTLFTPFVDDEGEIAGMFPEQTPYLEWQNSIFSQKEIHCQDCHMPRIDEAVKISSMPPWIGTQSPFWRHQFVGGNAFMLQIIRDNAAEIGATATAAQFDKTIAQTRMQLREKTASLNVQPSRKGGQLLLEVEIANRTGHKFPTGFPGRRAWLPDADLVAAGVERGDTLTLTVLGELPVRLPIGGVVPVELRQHPNAGDAWQADSPGAGDLVYNTACELLFADACPYRRALGPEDPGAGLPQRP